MRLVPKRLRWMGFGALAAWLFDSEKGRARRTELADRSSAVLRKAGRRVEGRSRYAADKLQGLGHKIGPNKEQPVDVSP
jgi:hypothetical protein